MRNFFLALVIVAIANFKAQAQLIADPGIEQVSFTDLSGNAIDDTMPIGYVAQLNIPIRNYHPATGIPAGTCKVKIGLGSKIIVDPAFDVALASTSEYFNWTSDFVGGQVQITGELRVPLPAGFSGMAKFNVVGNILDYSTITTNFLITNHNSPVILSDEDPGNNSSFRRYKIVETNPIPVHFSSVEVMQKGCNAEVIFNIENEINVKQYNIEVSTNGNNFSLMGSITACGLSIYQYQTSLTGSEQMFIRIKSIDHNGDYKYSYIVTLNGTCTKKLLLTVFPNPILTDGQLTIKATEGLLDGKYLVLMHDMTGRKLAAKQFTLANQTQFVFEASKQIAAGQYILTVIDEKDNTVTGSFIIHKK
jgi:hypothetical protein